MDVAHGKEGDLSRSISNRALGGPKQMRVRNGGTKGHGKAQKSHVDPFGKCTGPTSITQPGVDHFLLLAHNCDLLTASHDTFNKEQLLDERASDQLFLIMQD